MSQSDPTPLASMLERVVRGLGAPGTDAVELVFGRWEEVVGVSLASRTRPVSIQDGVLVLESDEPAVVSHVRYLEPRLVARLGELLGQDRVERVQVRVARPGHRRPGPSPSAGPPGGTPTGLPTEDP